MCLFQCVFADSANKLIFITHNHGRDIERIKLDFAPSEIAFSDNQADYSSTAVLLVLDKTTPQRRVRIYTAYAAMSPLQAPNPKPTPYAPTEVGFFLRGSQRVTSLPSLLCIYSMISLPDDQKKQTALDELEVNCTCCVICQAEKKTYRTGSRNYG